MNAGHPPPNGPATATHAIAVNAAKHAARWRAAVRLAPALALALGGCGGGGAGPEDASACPGFSAKLAGTWRSDSATTGLPLTLRFTPKSGDEGTVSGLAVSLGLPAEAPLQYGIATTCDAVLITTGGNPDNLIRAMPAEITGDAWLHLTSGRRDRYYWHDGSPRPKFPASLYVKQVVGVDPDQWRAMTGEVVRTGLGAFVAMGALPAGQDYSGIQLIEEVLPVPGSDDCSSLAVPALPQGTICAWDPNTAGFTFNLPHASGSMTLTPPQNDVIWDLHHFHGPASLLHRAGKTSCSTRCTQVYRYNGIQIGPAFSITYTLTRDDARGLTLVSVDKR